MIQSGLTHDIENKADKPVMRGQGKQHLVNQKNMLEVVDHTFAIQEVHRSGQEIPIQRFRKPNVLLFTRDIGDGDDLLERDDLDGCYNTNDVDVTGKHGNEKTRYHHERPYCPSNECLLLLFIFRQRRFLRFLLGNNQPGVVRKVPNVICSPPRGL